MDGSATNCQHSVWRAVTLSVGKEDYASEGIFQQDNDRFGTQCLVIATGLVTAPDLITYYIMLTVILTYLNHIPKHGIFSTKFSQELVLIHLFILLSRRQFMRDMCSGYKLHRIDISAK